MTKISALVICLVISVLVQQSLQLSREKRQFPNGFRQRPPFRGGGFQPDNDAAPPQQQRQRQRLPPGQELIFSNTGAPATTAANPTTPASTTTTRSPGQVVFVNNLPTVATMAPFMTPTTPSPAYMSCFNSCPTTPEYNPVCGSDQEIYFNEQKFNCALRCGADIQIVRRGSCEGLFVVQRG